MISPRRCTACTLDRASPFQLPTPIIRQAPKSDNRPSVPLIWHTQCQGYGTKVLRFLAPRDSLPGPGDPCILHKGRRIARYRVRPYVAGRLEGLGMGLRVGAQPRAMVAFERERLTVAWSRFQTRDFGSSGDLRPAGLGAPPGREQRLLSAARQTWERVSNDE